MKSPLLGLAFSLSFATAAQAIPAPSAPAYRSPTETRSNQPQSQNQPERPMVVVTSSEVRLPQDFATINADFASDERRITFNLSLFNVASNPIVMTCDEISGFASKITNPATQRMALGSIFARALEDVKLVIQKYGLRANLLGPIDRNTALHNIEQTAAAAYADMQVRAVVQGAHLCR